MTGGPTSGSADAGADVGELRRCVSDIVGLSTLSAMWARATRPQIADSLALTLRDTLGADLVYVALRGTATGAACEVGNVGRPEDEPLCESIRGDIARWFRETGTPGSHPTLSAAATPLLVTPIGIHAEHGVIVTMSRHSSFPSDIHRLLLNTAANQATVALLTDRARD